MTDYTHHIADETLILMPERAAYWVRPRTLFVADTHFSENTVDADLARLSAALKRMEAQRLIVLGDLLYEPRRFDGVLTAFSVWRHKHHTLKINLVRSEADRQVSLPDAWDITEYDGPTPGPYFVLNHAPIQPMYGYALAGQVHPHVRGDNGVLNAVFWFKDRCGVLPAFGEQSGVVTEVAPDIDMYEISDGRVQGVML